MVKVVTRFLFQDYDFFFLVFVVLPYVYQRKYNAKKKVIRLRNLLFKDVFLHVLKNMVFKK